ncbi:related to LEO1 Extremely hydrophilic protein [Rhynchosporium secalis]|uniref:Related to LEO1 Extremely hydrophilic protein n=1 Tax=Rhynchosporium secalis TaxID=38038 RepID=A0A1E1MGB4_RHYSE|nr:related to LEO1 Extremely hydrophilic protein [Rhynchosporium secalis]
MPSDSEDDLIDPVVDGDDDLFGDDDEAPAENVRELSDRELDSGDDEDRRDRARGDEDGDVGDSREARVMETTLWRHPVPKPVDGQLNALRLPTFMGIDPHQFNPDTFRPPPSDHHVDTKSANFLASAVAASTMRYRTNPTTGKLESNANLYKWSDGTTSISIGDQHYELQTKSLAPPKDVKPYQEVTDSHAYLASPSIASAMLVMVGHMTNQYTVRPNKDIQDDALEKLQKNLAAATRGGRTEARNGPELISNTEDPELQHKKAEIAEKERMRAQRRRETAAEKAVHPRGPGGSRGGLNVDDLEGRAGRRAPASGRKAPRARQRRADYDSDDDLPRGGRNREDEYDKEDDFLASSDEDMEEGGDDDEEEEEILDDDSDKDRHRSKKIKTSKSKPEELSDADADADAEADAEADLDDDEAPPAVAEPVNRGRKRNVIEDDDDE